MGVKTIIRQKSLKSSISDTLNNQSKVSNKKGAGSLSQKSASVSSGEPFTNFKVWRLEDNKWFTQKLCVLAIYLDQYNPKSTTKAVCLGNLLWSNNPGSTTKAMFLYNLPGLIQPRVNNKSYMYVSLQFTWIKTTSSQQQKLCVLAIYLDQNDPRSTTKAICLGNKLYLDQNDLESTTKKEQT